MALDPAQVNLDRLVTLQGRETEVEVMAGGITTLTLRVQTTDGMEPKLDLVVRSWLEGAGWMEINRNDEVHNCEVAHEAGVAKRVVEFRPEAGMLVTEFVPGFAHTDESIREPQTLARVGRTIRQLHSARDFHGSYNILAARHQYLDTALQHDFEFPPGYHAFEGHAQRIEAALARHPEPHVPCHNDLLPANFVDDGTRLWILDFEVSSMWEPSAELGFLWTSADMELPHLEQLVAAYDGQPSPARVARARAWAILGAYMCPLWSSIMASYSSMNYDYDQWGARQFERAVAEFTDPGFESLLNHVAAG